jgi:iron complex transport system ATP-binding protein
MSSKDNGHWIALENVSFVRRRRAILEAIDWSVAPGEHWVVLGANGSGKTTLLQLLAGYLWPTRGRVTVLGHRFGLVDLRELRKRIGWVGSFLQTPVPFSQDPLEFVVSGKFASIGIYEKPEEGDYRQAQALAERLGCAGVLDRPYGVLSQGEKQRLLIARALIPEPQLLILDEPCAGLDLVAREHLLQSLEELGQAPDAPNLVLVTHHLEEAMPVFSHALVLKDGRCLARGRKGDIFRQEILSEAFDIPVKIHFDGLRYWLHASFS